MMYIILSIYLLIWKQNNLFEIETHRAFAKIISILDELFSETADRCTTKNFRTVHDFPFGFVTPPPLPLVNVPLVGTIWRALSKPPQRRQGPDLRPLWLLVGTPSAIRPELAFSRAEHSLPYSDVTIYIFAILYLSSMLYVYRFLWPLRLGWLLVCCLYKEVYLQIFKCMSFWLHGCCG